MGFFEIAENLFADVILKTIYIIFKFLSIK